MVIIAIIVYPAYAGTIKGQIKATRGLRHLEHAVAYIERIEDKEFSVPDERPVMDQKSLVFTPHILPILVGTTVDFRNSDTFKHNIFTPDKIADSFNLGTFGSDVVRSYTFKRPGIVVILCNIHAEMEACVVVLENPYFAKVDKMGRFSIPNIPAGTYQLKVWHEDADKQGLTITVPEDGEVELSLTLTKKKSR